jgi:hypothetical protein
MILGCILCGGVIETMLVISGLGVIYNWFKHRHKKDNCKCCKSHREGKNNDSAK